MQAMQVAPATLCQMQSVPVITEEDLRAMTAMDTDGSILLLDVRAEHNHDERYVWVQKILVSLVITLSLCRQSVPSSGISLIGLEPNLYALLPTLAAYADGACLLRL